MLKKLDRTLDTQHTMCLLITNDFARNLHGCKINLQLLQHVLLTMKQRTYAKRDYQCTKFIKIS